MVLYSRVQEYVYTLDRKQITHHHILTDTRQIDEGLYTNGS
jgi:hypothetical protein